MSARARLAAAALPLALLVAGACGGRGPQAPAPPAAGRAQPPAVDSITIALWRFDEAGGTHVADAGPFALHGTAGLDTRPDFGRYGGARVFTGSTNSFVEVPYNPALESPRGFTVEAWLYLNNVSDYELSPIALRWTPVPTEQSWVFAVCGRRLIPPAVQVASPGWFTAIAAQAQPGHLLFAFVPENAGAVVVLGSSDLLPTGRWVHVAATADGEVARLYVDGRLDAQLAIHDAIRRTSAPLLVGNALDPRLLTTFGGDLRMDTNADPNAYYALDGSLDELRLSSLARTRFESADLR